MVVLPTPPFWFATASTRAIRPPDRVPGGASRPAEHRHAQRDDAAAISSKAPPFIASTPSSGATRWAQRADELGKLGEGARDDDVESCLGRPALHAIGSARRSRDPARSRAWFRKALFFWIESMSVTRPRPRDGEGMPGSPAPVPRRGTRRRRHAAGRREAGESRRWWLTTSAGSRIAVRL